MKMRLLLILVWVLKSYSWPFFVMSSIPFGIIGAIWGHAGFDALVIAKKNKVPLGHFDHQLHHRYFECNYGTFESPCDKWFNTFHDGTPEATQIMRNRRHKIHNI